MLQAKFDRVIVERESLQKKDSLIYIPDDVAAENAPAKGRVISVGPTAGIYTSDGTQLEKVSEGDVVIFAKHAGTKVTDGEKDYWLISDTDILAQEV